MTAAVLASVATLLLTVGIVVWVDARLDLRDAAARQAAQPVPERPRL